MQHRECFETMGVKMGELSYYLQHTEYILLIKEDIFGKQKKWVFTFI